MVMDGRDFCIPLESNDFAVLSQALRDQQRILQRVCAELEEEREASSSASNEAMGMILRLQTEKAKLKMETGQYQREVEATLNFAKDSIAGFEDLMCQREMEMEYLESQVQAYTSKLLSVGCTDLSVPDYQFPKSVQQKKNENDSSDVVMDRAIPIIPTELFPKRISVEREKSGVPIPILFRKKREDLNVYWERIKELDEQVKKISEKVGRSKSTSPRNKLRSCSVPPPNFDDFTLLSSGHQLMA